MNTILIGYDLNKLGQQYKQLIDAIEKTFPVYWHCLDSTWLVKTAMSAVQVRDLLLPHLDANDELLTINVTGCARAWQGFNEQCASWLRDTF